MLVTKGRARPVCGVVVWGSGVGGVRETGDANGIGDVVQAVRASGVPNHRSDKLESNTFACGMDSTYLNERLGGGLLTLTADYLFQGYQKEAFG